MKSQVLAFSQLTQSAFNGEEQLSSQPLLALPSVSKLLLKHFTALQLSKEVQEVQFPPGTVIHTLSQPLELSPSKLKWFGGHEVNLSQTSGCLHSRHKAHTTRRWFRSRCPGRHPRRNSFYCILTCCKPRDFRSPHKFLAEHEDTSPHSRWRCFHPH